MKDLLPSQKSLSLQRNLINLLQATRWAAAVFLLSLSACAFSCACIRPEASIILHGVERLNSHAELRERAPCTRNESTRAKQSQSLSQKMVVSLYKQVCTRGGARERERSEKREKTYEEKTASQPPSDPKNNTKQTTEIETSEHQGVQCASQLML